MEDLTDSKPNADLGSSVLQEDEEASGSSAHMEMSCKRKSSSKEPKETIRVKGKSKKSLPKKKPLRKRARMITPSYTIQETDSDMLLIISNLGDHEVRRKTWEKKKKSTKRGAKQLPPNKRRSKLKCKVEKNPAGQTRSGQTENDAHDNFNPAAVAVEIGESNWGLHLPVEILVRIFQDVVNQDGAVPFLCRVSRVCRLWCCAASSPVLWRSVTLSFCWVAPGAAQTPKTEQKIKDTVTWLSQNRFSQLREFAICHWKNLVDYSVKTVAQLCPHLKSIKLLHCSGVGSETFESLASGCQQLESLNLQHSQVETASLINFLEKYGGRLKHLWITYTCRLVGVINAISKGCCPELQLLEINNTLQRDYSDYRQFQLGIEALQLGCPKLQVLRLLNLLWLPKSSRASAFCTAGFPHLEELCLATSFFSFVEDQILHRILHESHSLRVLDLRGCYRITPTGLAKLPCKNVECLYLGLYCSGSSSNQLLPKEGSYLFTEKWHHCLAELDLSGHVFSENDLETAIAKLAINEGRSPLRSLNLGGTKISLNSVRQVITQCPQLSFLNLASCRHLPRGWKRAYKGQEDIRQLLLRLLESKSDDSVC
ncbi:F-box/LRR-repeat protein 6 [Polypterus senegalus]|uniref:F-box/LRR-repeat protein 6 n=1 Tax=Polypterus senegalus TaxID=55291 RepID=UPI001962A719|nr:F-box/LRR-repeat protein 6 [Polypterus senegalus]XP_039593318.1 F-box/LRR-repeat protein 6 [Polypterus senegalus]